MKLPLLVLSAAYICLSVATSAEENRAPCVDKSLMSALKETESTRANCSERCPDGSLLSCTGAAECSAKRRDCALGEPGHVICDGIKKSCSPCACLEGSTRPLPTSICCCNYDFGTPFTASLIYIQTCVNGTWTITDSTCGGANCNSTEPCPL